MAGTVRVSPGRTVKAPWNEGFNQPPAVEGHRILRRRVTALRSRQVSWAFFSFAGLTALTDSLNR